MNDDIIERLARVYCKSYGLNPDVEGVGLGDKIPVGERYKLWEYQAAFMKDVWAEVEKILEEEILPDLQKIETATNCIKDLTESIKNGVYKV